MRLILALEHRKLKFPTGLFDDLTQITFYLSIFSYPQNENIIFITLKWKVQQDRELLPLFLLVWVLCTMCHVSNLNLSELNTQTLPNTCHLYVCFCSNINSFYGKLGNIRIGVGSLWWFFLLGLFSSMDFMQYLPHKVTNCTSSSTDLPFNCLSTSFQTSFKLLTISLWLQKISVL